MIIPLINTYCYSNVAQVIGEKYQRAEVLQKLGLQMYEIGIKHQKELLTKEQFLEFRDFNLRFNQSKVCLDKSAFFQREIESLDWMLIQRRITFDFREQFSHNELRMVWEKDKKVLSQDIDFGIYSNKSRRSIVKSMMHGFLGFKYSERLTTRREIFFETPISTKVSLVLSIDTHKLNLNNKTVYSNGVITESILEANISLLFEDNNKLYMHFFISFDDLFPLSEGIACLAYKSFYSDEDLIALIILHKQLYTMIQEKLFSAINRDTDSGRCKPK